MLCAYDSIGFVLTPFVASDGDFGQGDTSDINPKEGDDGDDNGGDEGSLTLTYLSGKETVVFGRKIAELS